MLRATKRSGCCCCTSFFLPFSFSVFSAFLSRLDCTKSPKVVPKVEGTFGYRYHLDRSCSRTPKPPRNYVAYFFTHSAAVWSCFSRLCMYSCAMLATRGSPAGVRFASDRGRERVCVCCVCVWGGGGGGGTGV